MPSNRNNLRTIMGGRMSDKEILNWLIEQLETYSVMSQEDIAELLLRVEEKRK